MVRELAGSPVFELGSEISLSFAFIFLLLLQELNAG